MRNQYRTTAPATRYLLGFAARAASIRRLVLPLLLLGLLLTGSAWAQGAAANTAAPPNAVSPPMLAPVTAAPLTAAPLQAVPSVTAVGPVAAAGELPADLSIAGMFSSAHPIVKGVMALLALASVLTWTICLFKGIELAAARSAASSDLRTIATAGTLNQLSNNLRKGAIAELVDAAQLEIYASETLPADGIKERVQLALQRVEATAARRISIGIGVLASIGSTGPFVGLFGTVWGIMNSFIGISNSHTTNLAVVAPGIAEALLATAMGLVAAIPAVVIYNVFSRSIASYRLLLANGCNDIMRHVSRDLDRTAQTGYARLAAE